MKIGIWTLVLALVLYTSSSDAWVPDAFAVVCVGTTCAGSTNTSTNTSFSGGSVTQVSTSTDTNTRSSSNTNTNTNTNTVAQTVTQLQHQQDTNNLNQQGDSSSTSLGLAAIAAGMAMVAAGMAMMASPPTAAAGAALVAAGMMLIAAGMAALAAASNMRKNANQAAGYAGNLGPSLSDISTGTGTNTSTNTGTDTSTVVTTDPGNLTPKNGGSSIKIDPSLARNGKVGTIMDDFEKKTGMSADDLVKGLNDGKSPMEILAGAPKLGGKSEADLQRMMDKSLANNSPLSGQDVMSKLGLTAEDLNAKNEGAYTQGGGDRKNASTSGAMADFDSLFGKNDLDANAGKAFPGANVGALSPEVQAALDRNGITGRTIFEMVHTQYSRKTPLMFGVKREQIQGSKPLFDLKGGSPLDF